MTRSARLAAVAILGGLAFEAISLAWVGPEAFLTFLVGGGILLGGGVLVYLGTLLRSD